MDLALYAAASGMAAQQRSIDITAENLSNLHTTGYQPLRAQFADVLGLQAAAAPGQAPAVALGVASAGVRRLVGQGALQPTGDPFDFALDGPGFFRLQRPDGSEVYSRAGHFHPDQIGRLVDDNGNLLLGTSGPLLIPSGATGLRVDEGGRAVAFAPDGSQVSVGQLSLADFDDPGALLGGAGSLVPTAAAGARRTGAPGAGGLGRVHQGHLEDASVDLVAEMTNLMQAQRLYELNSRALQAADEMWQMANNLRR